MGITLHLDVNRRAIDPAAWAHVYDDTAGLLRAHPSGLLALERRVLFGRKIPVYTAHIERLSRGRLAWTVAGDRRSLRAAEPFRLPRQLPVPPPWCEGEHDCDDILFRDPVGHLGYPVFAARTDGEPYHVPLLAAAMVIETRFPGAALVWGDMDEEDVLEAKLWAERVLGREIALPVLLDAPALLRRLSARWDGEELLDAFVRRYHGRPAHGLALAFHEIGDARAEAWLRAGLRRPALTDPWWPGPAAFVQAWLMSGRGLQRLCQVASLDLSGPRLCPADLVAAMVDAWALVPPELAQRIERARRAPIMVRADAPLEGALVAAMVIHGWHPGAHVDPVEFEEALLRAFPACAAELCAKARADNAMLEHTIRMLCAIVERADRTLTDLGPFQDLGDLAALSTADDLTPLRRAELTLFACTLTELWPPGLTGREADCLDGRDPEAARWLLLAAAESRDLALTEEAWAWLLQEEDPALLAVMARLACTEPRNDEGLLVIRALLESRVLCAEVARMMSDASLMAGARAALLEEERRREQTRRALEARARAAAGPHPC
ncbi:MAG: hypothetical protein IT372_10695 [Polyangiaceae bacterium]|nr:hypothetical protein [Polyangiaceae bacterium]